MALTISRFVSTDLYAENDSVRFGFPADVASPALRPPLAAITFVAERTDLSHSLQDLALACGREAFSLANSTCHECSRRWLFVADGPWREANRIVRHQKLWKNHRDLVAASAGGHKSDEVAIEVGNQVRYAGLLEIPDGFIETAINATRVCSSYAIIFSNRTGIVSSLAIRQIFEQAFPVQGGIEQASIDWMSLAIALCPQGDVLMRVSGLFDDREAAVDLIATPGTIATLGAESRPSPGPFRREHP